MLTAVLFVSFGITFRSEPEGPNAACNLALGQADTPL